MVRRRSRARLVFAVSALAAALLSVPRLAAQSTEQQLEEARQLYNVTKWEDAGVILDRIVTALEPRASQDANARAQLVAAYELRARVRVGLDDRNGAERDVQSLLRVKPDYQVPPGVTVKLSTLFESVRKATIGDVMLKLTPETADVLVDGAPVGGSPTRLVLTGGPHTVAARRAGYKTRESQIIVTPGGVLDLALELERSAATYPIITSPDGIDVIVDGTPRGTTKKGDAPRDAAEIARQLSVDPSTLSTPLVLTDLTVGTHTIQYRRPCYRPEERPIRIDQLTDYRAQPVKMTPAVASVRVESPTPGATVELDGVPRGAAPVALTDVCEGSRLLSVRSPYGRFVSRLDVHAGDTLTIVAAPRPAFAILSTSGAEDSIRGAEDLRVVVEKALTQAAAITVFAPPPDRAQQALASQNLSRSWLAFDRLRKPTGDASKFTASARRELSSQLARSLDAQGVAAITVGPDAGPQSEILISLLAAGSSEPDVLALRLEDLESTRRALDELDFTLPLYRTSAGMLVIDVEGAPGAVVASVDQGGPAAAAGIMPGNFIVNANGKPTPDAVAFTRALEALNGHERMAVSVRDKGGAVRNAEIAVVPTLRAVSVTDQTLHFNPLLAVLRARVAGAAGTADEAVLRLNMAIALMRLGNFADARAELERVRLGDGGAVADGTVRYLLGLCYEALGQTDQAIAAWTNAAASAAWLTEDGPPVKGLAEARLRAAAAARSGTTRP